MVLMFNQLPPLSREQRQRVWWIEESRRRRQLYFQGCALLFMQLADVDSRFIEYAKKNMRLADEEAAR